MCTTSNHHHFRQCIVCEKQLLGRRDKVFCDIICKNHYHSEIRRTTRSIASETIRILRRNYVILEGFMTDKAQKFTINKIKLEQEGFKFQYVTHIQTNFGFTTFSIFNMDYFLGKNNQITVRRTKQSPELSPFLFKRWLSDLPNKIAV